MFRKVFCFLMALFIFNSSLVFGELQNCTRNGVKFVWEEVPNFDSMNAIFQRAFRNCYDKLELEELQKSSSEELHTWLEDTFKEEYELQNSSPFRLWLSAKINNSDIGFINIDTSKYPDEIYIATISVDPSYQRNQIGTSLVDILFEQFPECKKFSLITRLVNQPAVDFYLNYGFVRSSYMYEGYDEKLYGGLEYVR